MNLEYSQSKLTAPAIFDIFHHSPDILDLRLSIMAPSTLKLAPTALLSLLVLLPTTLAANCAASGLPYYNTLYTDVWSIRSSLCSGTGVSCSTTSNLVTCTASSGKATGGYVSASGEIPAQCWVSSASFVWKPFIILLCSAALANEPFRYNRMLSMISTPSAFTGTIRVGSIHTTRISTSWACQLSRF